jgi:predicted nuclease with TOPRIM domain
MDIMRMKKPNLIGQAIEKFLENYDENEAYLKSQRALRADCEARHKRLEDLKKQALTNENNFDCKGCA